MLCPPSLQPEGLPRDYTYSVFFCPNGQTTTLVLPTDFLEFFKNDKRSSLSSFFIARLGSVDARVSSSSAERIHISTPNKYEYQYVRKPARMTQFQVAVKTHNDAHFALSASPHDSAEMIEIVLGGRQNTRSWISVGKMGEPLVSAATPGILSWDEFRSFWISWRGGVAQVQEPSAAVGLSGKWRFS